MKLHEYQAKALLRKFGLPVPAGEVVFKPDEVAKALSDLGFEQGIAKAQAFTGGRGKAGGIKKFSSSREAEKITGELLGMKLITKQTGPQGMNVDSVLLEDLSEIERELYLAVTLDRSKSSPVIMLCAEGGMEIEELAESRPEAILKLYPEIGKPPSQKLCDEAAEFLGLGEQGLKQFPEFLTRLYEAYQKSDCMLMEINPLVENTKGLIPLDCKVTIDDNALFRQSELGGDPSAEKTDEEVEASKFGLSYIKLDGNIGCMVNGAGLAMATMDIISHHGEQPANFLDVGGSANEEAVTKAFQIITSDKHVKAILVNIFGGIMKCDTIANGIIAAVKKSHLEVPLVVRLEGTNVMEGKKLINESGLNLISADTLEDGAAKVVKAVRG